MTTFFVAGEETDDLKWVLKNEKKHRNIILYNSWKFHENYLSILRNSAEGKEERKQTHYNHYHVFRWKQTTLMINECQTISETKALLRLQYRSFHIPSCSISTQFSWFLPLGCPGNQLLKVTLRLEFSNLYWPSTSRSLSPIHKVQS